MSNVAWAQHFEIYYTICRSHFLHSILNSPSSLCSLWSFMFWLHRFAKTTAIKSKSQKSFILAIGRWLKCTFYVIAIRWYEKSFKALSHRMCVRIYQCNETHSVCDAQKRCNRIGCFTFFWLHQFRLVWFGLVLFFWFCDRHRWPLIFYIIRIMRKNERKSHWFLYEWLGEERCIHDIFDTSTRCISTGFGLSFGRSVGRVRRFNEIRACLFKVFNE